MERIVLAYSGGLETSAAIPWLRDACGAEVITVTVDLGQGGELEEVRDRALAAGAVRAHVLDLREELARACIVPALKAGAMLDAGAPLALALGRPLVARALLTITGIERATAVAHGSSGRGPHPGALDTAIRGLNPALRIVAPAREWAMTRQEIFDYASRRHIPVPALSSPFSVAGNLWGRSITSADLDDSWTQPPDELYVLTKPPAERPSEAACVEISFERGVPAAINGVAMPLLDLISSLTTIAGAHGVGRLDLVERRPSGRESRIVHEAPAAVVLHAAHADLEAFVTIAEVERFSRIVSQQYAELIASGLWYSPLRTALDAFVDRVQERVTGVVRLELFQGGCRIVGRKSPHAGCGDTAPTQPVVVGA
jgi:argininosuccinate synthase